MKLNFTFFKKLQDDLCGQCVMFSVITTTATTVKRCDSYICGGKKMARSLASARSAPLVRVKEGIFIYSL